MMSQVERVVISADVSFNTELDILSKLSSTAQRLGRTHGVVLMVELGDLREGILPEDLEKVVRGTRRFPNLVLHGIGANLACRSGVEPDENNMAELSALADSLEATFGCKLQQVSGGNSANLQWALGSEQCKLRRVDNLRLGEAILLGCEPLCRQPIDGLYTDAIQLVAEVIESKLKPSLPWGKIAQNAFGESSAGIDRGRIPQAILAIGHQDTDPNGIRAMPGVEMLGASSDHLIVESAAGQLPVGSKLTFQLNYSALLRAMTSPFVAKVIKNKELCNSLQGQLPDAA